MSDEELSRPSVERVSERTFLIVTWFATGLAALFLTARLMIRVKSFSKLLLDDYFVIAGWLMLLASAIVWQIKGSILWWMYDVQSGRRPPTPDFAATYSTFVALPAVWNILFYTSLWTVKFSFLIFFRTLGFKVNQNRVWWWIVSTIALCGWAVCIGDIDFKCTLNDYSFIMNDCPKRKHVKFQDITFYVNMGIDVLTDLLILSIPFRILWNVKIPRSKKIVLLGLFSLTIVIMVVSIIRVTVVKRVGGYLGEQTATIEWIYLWSYVEVTVAIIVASTASFRQLFVYTKKQQSSQKTHSRLGSFLRGLISHQRTSREKVDKHEYHPSDQAPGYPGEGGSEHNMVPLGPVQITRSFDVASAKSAPGGHAKAVSPPTGHEYV